jgi:hypothetical protein
MDLFYDDWEPIIKNYWIKHRGFKDIYEIWDELLLPGLQKYDREYDFDCYSDLEVHDVLNSALWGCAAMRACHPLYKREENTIETYLRKIKNELIVSLQTKEVHQMVKMEMLIRDLTHGWLFIRPISDHEFYERKVYVPMGYDLNFYEKYYDVKTEMIYKANKTLKFVKKLDEETGDIKITTEQAPPLPSEERSWKLDIFDSTKRLLDLINILTDPDKDLLPNGLLRRSPLSLKNSKEERLSMMYHTVFPWFSGLGMENLVLYPNPDPEKMFRTTQGAYMCLGTTPALLTFLNHIAHFGLYERKLLRMGDFATVGDDNISGHKNEESIEQLQTEQENVGFKVQYKKSWKSKKGYLLAEKLWLRNPKGGFREINNFKARYFIPKKRGNHWLTIPTVAYESLRSASLEFRRRAMSVIFSQYKRNYEYCLKAGLNIFETPIHKPMFPMNLLAKKGNFLYEAFMNNKSTQIKNIFTAKDYTQDTDRNMLRELIDNLPGEGVSWSMPTFGRDFNYRPAEKREWRKGDLLNALTARSVNNPYRNPRASQHPQTVTAEIATYRFLKLKGEKHLSKTVHNLKEWEEEKVQTSLMGILSNQRNFDMSKVFQNDIYDTLKDVYIFDGRVIEGCSQYKVSEEYKLEQQVLGAVCRQRLEEKNILFLILAPKYGPDNSDRQTIYHGNYFSVWFRQGRKLFIEFVKGCFRTFTNYERKYLVTYDRQIIEQASSFRIISPNEFFNFEQDYLDGENIVGDPQF